MSESEAGLYFSWEPGLSPDPGWPPLLQGPGCTRCGGRGAGEGTWLQGSHLTLLTSSLKCFLSVRCRVAECALTPAASKQPFENIASALIVRVEAAAPYSGPALAFPGPLPACGPSSPPFSSWLRSGGPCS